MYVEWKRKREKIKMGMGNVIKNYIRWASVSEKDAGD